MVVYPEKTLLKEPLFKILLIEPPIAGTLAGSSSSISIASNGSNKLSLPILVSRSLNTESILLRFSATDDLQNLFLIIASQLVSLMEFDVPLSPNPNANCGKQNPIGLTGLADDLWRTLKQESTSLMTTGKKSLIKASHD
jgi:hypothetical protein